MDGSINPPNPKQRYGDLKVPLGYVPSSAITYAALALEEGARKYGPYNWRDRAVEAMTYVHAAERHLRAWVDGENTDPDSGFPHLGHALACLSILADAITVGNLIDNRPKPCPTADLLRLWEKPPPAPDWPFRDHRTMAEVIAEEACQLDGRNCPPEHDHPSFGEGDETMADNTLEPPKAALCLCDPLECSPGKGRVCRRNHEPTTRHTHRWRISDDPEMMECMVERCGAVSPAIDQTPGMYALDLDRKFPCHCREMDRCKVENGHLLGNNVFCCKAEAGR
ncbi:MAG: dATP/dGTP diphosphohydrolase domain-containing protein [Alphaproteobacteria bacterium]